MKRRYNTFSSTGKAPRLSTSQQSVSHPVNRSDSDSDSDRHFENEDGEADNERNSADSSTNSVENESLENQRSLREAIDDLVRTHGYEEFAEHVKSMTSSTQPRASRRNLDFHSEERNPASGATTDLTSFFRSIEQRNPIINVTVGGNADQSNIAEKQKSEFYKICNLFKDEKFNDKTPASEKKAEYRRYKRAILATKDQLTDPQQVIKLFTKYAGTAMQKDIEEILKSKTVANIEELLTELDKTYEGVTTQQDEENKLDNIYQKAGEGVDDFEARLRFQAIMCNFATHEQTERAVRNGLLKRSRPEIIKQIKVGAALSNSTVTTIIQTIKQIEQETKESAGIRRIAFASSSRRPRGFGRGYQNFGNRRNFRSFSSKGNADSCGNCGQQNHKTGDKSCKAMGKKCNKCGKLNHFAKVCRSANADSTQRKFRRHENINLTETEKTGNEEETSEVRNEK